MSGLLFDAETPCPRRSNSSRFDRSSNGSNTLDSFWDDNLDSFEDTRDIDFTTEIRAPILTAAKPRRGNRTTTSFQIHDDNEGKTAPGTRRKRKNMATAPSSRKTSLLSQPAQRFRPRDNFAASPPSKPQRQPLEPKNSVGRNSNVERNKVLLAQINGKNQEPQEKDDLKRDVRRNTVYIPPDDTTVASIFMGLFSPLKSQMPSGTGELGPEDSQINSLESRIAARRVRRANVHSPKRAPLQPSAKIAQEASIRMDIAGKNGGKENVPPGAITSDKSKDLVTHSPVTELPQKPRATPDNVLPSSKLEPQPARTSANFRNTGHAARRSNGPSPKRPVLGNKQYNKRTSTFETGKKRDSLSKQQQPEKRASVLRSLTSSDTAKRSRMTTSNPMSDLKLKKLNTDYQLLTEGISNPAMYEDNWLLHQEIVITQLVNGLFHYTSGNSNSVDPESLRYELLKLYQNDFFLRLHRRLQLSLECGPMSMPNFVLARSNSLKHDVGLKRKFINIWTRSYNLHALRAAVETVVGRRIDIGLKTPQRSITSSPYGSNANDKILRQKLEHFIETFLLRNEDMDRRVSGYIQRKSDVGPRAYRRTVLRSVMIVALLDKGRLSSGMMLPRQLFSSSSNFKSSAAVVQALGRLLLPSIADITKPLGHLGCRLLYKQKDLQEYKYEISNLAVDLRDGVRLTRIVELLLYSSSSRMGSPEPDCSTTVTLLDGKLLPLAGDDGNCPLSQHLRFPCVSRAVKLFNVRIALGALNSTMDTRAMVSDVRAEDIVDGHREKTIALLWGLVSNWGLGGLVDWDDVRKEIGRLQQKAISQFGGQVGDQDWFNGDNLGESSDEQSLLLKKWAAILGGMKGLRIENLSTNFADGKVYESIVDEYEGYILGTKDGAVSPVRKSREQANLGQRLQALGCSPQFGEP